MLLRYVGRKVFSSSTYSSASCLPSAESKSISSLRPFSSRSINSFISAYFSARPGGTVVPRLDTKVPPSSDHRANALPKIYSSWLPLTPLCLCSHCLRAFAAHRVVDVWCSICSAGEAYFAATPFLETNSAALFPPPLSKPQPSLCLVEFVLSWLWRRWVLCLLMIINPVFVLKTRRASASWHNFVVSLIVWKKWWQNASRPLPFYSKMVIVSKIVSAPSHPRSVRIIYSYSDFI